jgi:hypothetical protein
MARKKEGNKKSEATAKELEMLIEDIPYFHSTTSFCLGKSLEDAGEIVAKFLLEFEKTKGV